MAKPLHHFNNIILTIVFAAPADGYPPPHQADGQTDGRMVSALSTAKFKRERGMGEGPGEEGGSQGELGEGPGVADLQRCWGSHEQSYQG